MDPLSLSMLLAHSQAQPQAPASSDALGAGNLFRALTRSPGDIAYAANEFYDKNFGNFAQHIIDDVNKRQGKDIDNHRQILRTYYKGK